MGNYSNCHIAGIPCLQINPSINKCMGTVLLYHGWVSTINDYLFLASLIANWGYKVIVPELPYHGERGKLNYFDTLVLQQYFWIVVLQGVREAEAIAAELSVSEDKLGIVGHSAGGFIAAGAFLRVSCVQSAIVINGSCAWVKCEELFRETDGRSTMSSFERISLEQYDPASI